MVKIKKPPTLSRVGPSDLEEGGNYLILADGNWRAGECSRLPNGYWIVRTGWARACVITGPFKDKKIKGIFKIN